MAFTHRRACHLGLGLALIAAPWPVMAQAANPMPEIPCPAAIAASGPWAPWTAPTTVAAGLTENAAPVLTPGHAVAATLVSTPQVTYALPPQKPGGPSSHGGLLALRIDTAGTYRIALSSATWIDVVRDGQPVFSIAHGHGPDCTGIHKIVDFALQPGRYLVQLSASAAPTVEVLVIRSS